MMNTLPTDNITHLSPEMKNVFLRASISDVCNFTCQYCAKDLGMENHTPACCQSNLLSTEEYIRNMRLLAQHGFRTVSFTGGEPLLNPDFPEIATQCRKLFDTIEITTNGTRIPDYIEVIEKTVDVLKISVDAYDPILSSQIAGNSLAAKTTEIIEVCCQKGIQTIGLNFVYMKQNAKELEKLVDFAASLKHKYNTNLYISILDLYYSNGNRNFWQEQFVNLKNVRDQLTDKGMELNRRLRIGCDSYYFNWNGILITMKDSFSCTHRLDLCEHCTEYCQEGIYSLKHSASGWISVCPTNKDPLGQIDSANAQPWGTLINGRMDEQKIHEQINIFVQRLNAVKRVKNTGDIFCQRHQLDH